MLTETGSARNRNAHCRDTNSIQVIGGLMDIRSIQKPLKEQYRRDPASSRITLTAKGAETGTPLACSVDIGRAIYQAEAHKGVGGTGTTACSGDLLIGALAACAQLTCQLVATAMGVPTRHVAVTVSGEMDLQGTLGTSKEVPVGFEAIRVCNSTLTRRRQHRSNCWLCMRRQSNIASFCRRCCTRQRLQLAGAHRIDCGLFSAAASPSVSTKMGTGKDH